MYEQISRNKWKSVALVVFFMGFIFLLTWFFEYVTGWGKGGVVLAVVVAMGMAAVGYYQSDKIVLGISRARPVTKEEYPYLYNVVEGLAIAAGIPTPKCYVIDDTAPNAFAAGRAYIESQRLLIQPALQAGEAAQARAAFGRLSHTAQDFYAHTNYVDLWLNTHPAGSASSAIDPLDSEILNDSRLHSGRLYYPQEALYFIPFLRKFSLSILPPDSHALMNLDSAGQGPSRMPTTSSARDSRVG